MTAKLGGNGEIVLESKYAFDNRRAADLASDPLGNPSGSNQPERITQTSGPHCQISFVWCI